MTIRHRWKKQSDKHECFYCGLVRFPAESDLIKGRGWLYCRDGKPIGFRAFNDTQFSCVEKQSVEKR